MWKRYSAQHKVCPMSLLNTIHFITSHPLNKDHKFRSIIRFFKWQLGSRLVPGGVVFSWVNGSRILVQRGDTGLTGNVYCGLHEFTDMAYILHVLDETDLFVDVGANAGSYTILACAAAGARGYSIEPVPSTFAKLVTNVFLNKINERVECLNLGIGEKKDRLFFTSDQNCTNHVLSQGERSEKAVGVDVVPLDDLLENEAPSAIKIDVGGYETSVIQGARQLLSRKSLHSVIMELNGSGARYGFDEDEILKMMRDLGFQSYEYDPFARRLQSLKGRTSSGGNTLFLRNIKHIRERVENSPAVHVHGARI